MKHTVSVLCIVLALAACSKEPEKKSCIDPVTYANICVEQAIREEEAKSSSYLDMKYGAEDKAKEVAQAPPQPVAPGPVAPAPVQQTAAPARNHSSFIFLPIFMPSSAPAAPTFQYSRPAPPRPVQPVQPSVAARMATASARPLTAPAKPFLPPRPAPTIVRPVQPIRPTVPVTVSNPQVRQIPIVPQTAPKPVATPSPTVAPKPSWSAPKVTVTPSRPSVPATRSFSGGRR